MSQTRSGIFPSALPALLRSHPRSLPGWRRSHREQLAQGKVWGGKDCSPQEVSYGARVWVCPEGWRTSAPCSDG